MRRRSGKEQLVVPESQGVGGRRRTMQQSELPLELRLARMRESVCRACKTSEDARVHKILFEKIIGAYR